MRIWDCYLNKPYWKRRLVLITHWGFNFIFLDYFTSIILNNNILVMPENQTTILF